MEIKRGIALLLACAMAAAMSGCSFLQRGLEQGRQHASSSAPSSSVAEPSSSQEEQKPDPSTPDGAVATLLEAMKALDVQTVNAHTYSDQYNQMFGDELGEEELALCQQLFGNMEYQVGKAQVQGESATVEVTLTNTDFAGVLPKLMTAAAAAALQSGGKEPDYLALLTELLQEEAAAGKTKTTTDSLHLELRDGVWKVEQNTALADLLTGGLFTSAKELVESLVGKVESMEDLLEKIKP